MSKKLSTLFMDDPLFHFRLVSCDSLNKLSWQYRIKSNNLLDYSNLDYWDQKCPHKSKAAMCQYDFWGVCCVRPWKRNTKTTTHQNASVNTRIKRTTKTATTQTWSTRMSNPICICQLFCQFRISPINSFVKSSLRLELFIKTPL